MEDHVDHGLRRCLRYSPDNDMKWSFPNMVCRIKVPLRSLGRRLSREAVALSTSARNVTSVISSARRIPCINWLSKDHLDCSHHLPSWDGYEAIPGLHTDIVMSES